MVLLLLFAFVAGAATALTPCVLPVLPALLSAGGTGGRRRPLGIVAGLTVTHTIAIVGIASVVDGVGFADGTLRDIAIATLLAFGILLLVPALAHWLEAQMAFFSRFGPKDAGEGFWSGLPVGAALGFVYAPCAGPILAAVISVSASQGTTADLVAVGIAYSVGSAGTLLLLMLGGRKLMTRVRGTAKGPIVQQSMGAVLIVTAVLMFAELDIELQATLADDFPSFVTNPTKGLEDVGAVKDQLVELRGESKFDSDRVAASPRGDGVAPPAPAPAPGGGGSTALPGTRTPELPVLGMAPEFRDNQRWFNSEPLTVAGLRGRVTLIDFWTYTCINCIRTLPYLRSWDERYRTAGLTIVGVHTPEFAFEKEASNVEAAIRRSNLEYPVAQDNDFGTWNAWGNQYWPAKYLIDAQGRVRYTHFGEGDYKETEAAIRALLAEADRDVPSTAARTRGEVLRPGVQATPETYLGTGFGSRHPDRFTSGVPQGTRTYRAAPVSSLGGETAFSLGGRWKTDTESSTSRGKSTLRARVTGKAVYLVMTSKGGRPRDVRVRLDGRFVTAKDAGRDVRNGRVTVTTQRLYRLVELDQTEEHVLELGFEKGISAFAFTFG